MMTENVVSRRLFQELIPKAESLVINDQKARK